MGLTGKNNEEKAWNFLKGKIKNDFGVSGLMGELFAESGLNPQNLQNSYEKKLGFTDATYTAAVDSGSYANFVHDSRRLRRCTVDVLEPEGGAAQLCEGARRFNRGSGGAARLFV